MSCLDLEKHSWLHLPSAGGYYDQDEFLMAVWECVRYEYRLAVSDKKFMESLKNKYKG